MRRCARSSAIVRSAVNLRQAAEAQRILNRPRRTRVVQRRSREEQRRNRSRGGDLADAPDARRRAVDRRSPDWRRSLRTTTPRPAPDWRSTRRAVCSASPAIAADSALPLHKASPSFGPRVAGASPAARSASAPVSTRPSYSAGSAPDDHERDVREQPEIAGADRAPTRHDRGHVAVDAARSAGRARRAIRPRHQRHRVGARQHRRAHRGARQRLADADRAAPRRTASGTP